MFFNKQKNVALPFGRFYHYSGTVIQHIQGSSFVTDIYPEGNFADEHKPVNQRQGGLLHCGSGHSCIQSWTIRVASFKPSGMI